VFAILTQELSAASDKENLYPHANELLVGLVAFAVLFFFFAKWVLPRMNQLLDERRTGSGLLDRIQVLTGHVLDQGQLERSGIVARENVGYTQSDLRDELSEVVTDLLKAGRSIRGWVGFHGQDLERAVDGGGLHLGFAPAQLWGQRLHADEHDE